MCKYSTNELVDLKGAPTVIWRILGFSKAPHFQENTSLATISSLPQYHRVNKIMETTNLVFGFEGCFFFNLAHDDVLKPLLFNVFLHVLSYEVFSGVDSDSGHVEIIAAKNISQFWVNDIPGKQPLNCYFPSP